MPKPPGAPSLPKPPGAPPSAGAGIPKPPSAPSGAAAGPAPVTPAAPKPPPAATIAPAPLSASAKKETAKVPASTPGTRSGALPQATVQLKRPEASKSISTGAAITVAPAPEPAPAAQEGTPVLPIAAAAISAIALLIQLWIMLS